MKRNILVSLLSAIVITVTIKAQFNGGLGTKENPYLIATTAQLDSVHNHLTNHYKLLNDIDLSAYSNWTPIGNEINYFSGSFNGNGHIISNLNITTNSFYQAGLFGYFKPLLPGDSISNLGIINGNMNEFETEGLIVGVIQGGVIFRCFAHGDIIENSYSNIGLIVGNAISSTISNCYTIGSIASLWYNGGIVGIASNSTIEYCFSSASIEDGNNSGGIAGRIQNSVIQNCVGINAGIAGISSYSNRIVGGVLSSSLANNYAWDLMPVNNSIISNGTLTNANGLNLNTLLAKDSLFFKNSGNWTSQPWNFSTIWSMDTTTISPYPFLKIFNKNVQHIKHAQFLSWEQEFRANVYDTIYLNALGTKTKLNYTTENPEVNTIVSNKLIGIKDGISKQKAFAEGNNFFEADSVLRTCAWFYNGSGTKSDPYQISTINELNAIRVYPNLNYKLVNNLDLTQENWIPIGTESVNFTGAFDGNGLTINNLNIVHSEYYGGLFGYYKPIVPGDSIKNLGLTNVDIKSMLYTGSIVGYIEGGTIYDCYSTGNLSGNQYLVNSIGGICGTALYSEIKNCNSNVNINNGNCMVGGIAGELNSSKINNCYSKGNLLCYAWGAGGIAGSMYKSEIKNSFSAMNVGFKDTDDLGNIIYEAGGIAGYTDSSFIKNSYSTGQVWYDKNTGGIVGSGIASEIVNCYCSGYITNTMHTTGGIAGFSNNSTVAGNIAINAMVSGSDIINRILGSNTNSILERNYAWSDMFVKDNMVYSSQDASANGADISMAQAKDSVFYTNDSIWEKYVWDFEAVWTMDKNISPYPILKDIDRAVQKVKHMQMLTATWNQTFPELDKNETPSILLSAYGKSPSGLLAYSSEYPDIAYVSDSTLFLLNTGTTFVYAFYPETEFYYSSKSLSKELTIIEPNSLTDHTSLKFSIYPNPSVNYIIIKKDFEGQKGIYSLVNIAGEQILSGEVVNDITIVDSEILMPGIYLLTIQSGTQSIIYKVLRSK